MSISFKRGELVADGAGKLYEVSSQTADLVWAKPHAEASCPFCAVPLDARKLYRADAGFPEQYPREVREPSL